MRASIIIMFLTIGLALSADTPIDTWAVHDGQGRTHISGSGDDFRRIGELKKTLEGPFVYARTGRTAWLITDHATVVAILAVSREPSGLESRRRAIEVEMQEIDRAMRSLEWEEERVEKLEEIGDADWRDERRKVAEAERRLDEQESRVDELERALDREYDIWEEQVERDVSKLIGNAIASGMAVKYRR